MFIKILKLSLLLLVMCSSVSQAAVILKPLVYGEAGGDKIVYDSYQNITWTQNASLLGNSLTWHQAVSSADSLTYAGSSNWYLPTLTNLQTLWTELYIINGSVNRNQTGSPSFDSGAHTPNDHFTNVQNLYWSSNQHSLSSFAWYYPFALGFDAVYRGDYDSKNLHFSAWAIHQGNLIPQSTVPIPAAVWLFGSALSGLLFFGKRQTAAKLA